MLGGIFQKRKKIQELRAPSLQDIKRFREIYGRHAEARHVETPACFERSIYKAISCQRELHAMDFRQEDVTDPQIIALAETLLDMPLASSLDLRDNRITDDGAKALLEVLRLQIIAAKTPPKTDPKTKKLVPPPPVPEFTRYVTNVNLKGNEISASVLDEMAQYTELLKREDKRLEIRAALSQIDRNAGGGVDEEDFKAVVKLLTGTEPSKKEVKQLMSQSNVNSDNYQNSIALENVLLAKCSSSPSKKAACPPWEALVQVRHANIGPSFASPLGISKTGRRVESPPRGGHATSPFQTTLADTKPSSSSSSVILTDPSLGHIGHVTMATLSSSVIATSTTPAVSPPPAPNMSSSFNPGLSIATGPAAGDSSPSKPKLDFRPPASPPPPLPLPQTNSPERRGTVVSTPTKTRDSFESSSDQAFSASSGTSEGGTSSQSSGTPKAGGVPVFARQDSSESRRSVSAVLAPSAAVSPKARDDYTMDFSSWRDEDLFGEEHDDPLDSPAPATLMEVIDDIESVPSQEDTTNVASRVSTASLNRPGMASGNTSGCISSLNCEPSEGPPARIQADLMPLTYNSQNETVVDGSRLKREPEPVVEEDDDEEVDESIVLDIMKDGKPRNIAAVRHSEFKRGMILQDFPGEVPFRNLVALVLSENGLRELSLFKECRFPCTTVLDLSQNALTKVNDEDLACFPKLQVLDLSSNRLRVISGLGKVFDMKALSLCNNQLRSVINIEHLVHLQILLLRSNVITTSSALRLLSLNKMLSHLDLDDTPLMETDDRQRRKITVHILNIIPTLTTLGSVPIAGHVAKDKKKPITADAPMGRSLLEHEECPSLRSIWASNACDILQIVQDREQPPRRSSYDDDDPYGDSGAGGYSPTRLKKLSRGAQRQKDELRSKSVGYRSRDKAPPSPVRAKTSPFAFGPPLPPPPRKSPKKKALVDPKLAQEQKRRASQLSAPKHPPVDTDQLKQEQRRKSRPTFDVNMSVAERLQLAREKSLRRTSTLTPHTELAPNHRNSGSLHSTHEPKRVSSHAPALVMEIRDPSSPARLSPARHQSIVEFRVEPLPVESPRRSQESNQLLHSRSPQPTAQNAVVTTLPPADVSMERKTSLKESPFLQSLAVTDFLSHAEEEISTAQTALNVLLSMCERSPSDPKKLSEYRNSLDALDILDERESHDLYERARHHDDPHKARECTEAFEKLRTLKKCIKELLKKLETHIPGSPTIKSYCSEMRSTALRHLIESSADDQDTAVVSPMKNETVSEPAAKLVEARPMPSPTAASLDATGAKTLHSRLFATLQSETNEPTSVVTTASPAKAKADSAAKSDDDAEFDFLSSDSTMFDDDDVLDKPTIEVAEQVEVTEETKPADEDPFSEALESSVTVQIDTIANDVNEVIESATIEEPALVERNERSLSATSTDITQDIQQMVEDEEDDFDFDSELPLDEDAPTPSVESDAFSGSSGDSAPASPSKGLEGHDDADEQDDIDWDAVEMDEPTHGNALNDSGKGDFDQDTSVSRSDDTDLGEDTVVDPNVSAQLYQREEEQDKANVDQVEEEEEEEEEEGQEEQQQDTHEQDVAAADEDDEEAEMFGDWEKGFDPSTNHYFWFNHETGESQWVPPEGWPYEVDTPFEEDAQLEQDERVDDDDQEDVQDTTQQSYHDDESVQPHSPTKSSFDADDDVFSDNDLPDF